MENIFRMDGIFSDGMILQRGCDARLWGFYPDGQQVSAEFDGQACEIVYEDGRFNVIIPAQDASTSHTVTVFCGEESIVINDVCFGEVFLLSGQSNMQLPVERCMDVSGEEIIAADFPLIRQFIVEPRYYFGRQAHDLVANPWVKAIYPDVNILSAAGFFFAKRMQAELNVPIGLVLNAMGGSTIEAWLPEEALGQFGNYTELIDEFRAPDALDNRIKAEEQAAMQWFESLNKGNEIETASAVPADAESYSVPGMFFDTPLDGYTGSVWFYKEIELDFTPENECLLYVGELYYSDRAYINGQLVGETAYCYPVRRYSVPVGVLHKGTNLIAVRLVVTGGNGGFIPYHHYYLDTGRHRFDLCGEWKYKLETSRADYAPNVLFPPLLPTGLYNASLVPLKGISFKGALWYQGESNAGAPERYSDKFSAMVNIWREYLGQRLPIVCVELCNYVDPSVREVDITGWAEIQRQQREQPQHTPDCAVALADDLGEIYELHPQRKKELGERIAREMLKLVYGK